jgi:hypothetical protein
MVPQELLQALHSFSLKNKTDTVDLRQFISATHTTGSDAEIEAALKSLADMGRCVLLPSATTMQTVRFPDYFVLLLEEEYRAIGVDPYKPFPGEQFSSVPIPPEAMDSIDIKTGFGGLLTETGKEERPVAKLVFPQNVDALIVARSIAGTDLIEAAVAKLSAYLGDPKNAGYIESKLIVMMKSGDMLARQMLEDAAKRPKKASQSIFTPSDFSYRFWTYLVNLVLQDIGKKTEKTAVDQGVCQSAFIVGYYIFYKKSTTQKEQERAADRKSLEIAVRKPPYVFTFENLYALRDMKGVPYVTKHSHQFIHSFLEEKTQRGEDGALPFMVRLHDGVHNKDFYMQRDMLVPVFLKKLSEAAVELREDYINDWVAALRRRATGAVMKSDDVFRKDVEVRLKEGYPLVAALANAPLLYLAKTETPISEEAQLEIRRCFQPGNTLKPLNELLGLFRPALFSEARSYLPIWETMPLLRNIVNLFRRFLSGRRVRGEKEAAVPSPQRLPGKPAQPAAAKPQQGSPGRPAASERDLMIRYTKAIQTLRDTYLPQGKSIEKTLSELAAKWNPLFAESQKSDLVEDVNALVRDFLKPVKRTMLATPPNAARIHALAEQLSVSRSLEKIKKKEPLVRYIELYMIKSLEPKRKI